VSAAVGVADVATAGVHSPLAPGGSVSSLSDGAITDVCFGHPKSNSLPSTVLRSLADAIAAAGRRSETRVVVLRSYGTGAFCAGASFDELAAIRDAGMGKEFFLGFARVILAMVQCPKPIVTRIQGKVVGGGVGIVAASDYAIATSNASLRLSELAVGIGPFVVGPVIERKIGVGAFGGMAIDADWRDASWGERHGLYARVTDDSASLDQRVNEMAGKLASANPDAVARIKRIAWAGTDEWPRLLDERAAMSGTLVLSDFTRNAIAAFASRV
jgi:methylglutaconyl-CoA hydratase